MAYNFNANDVFEMAEQIESNGAKFYREVADSTDSEELKEVLYDLSKMEIVHLKLFQALREELPKGEKAATVFDPYQESTLYLQALVESRISFKHEHQIKSSVASTLKAAIESEKDTIIFYLGIKEAIPEKLGKAKIDTIIKEEMGHIRLLTQELKKLKT